MSSGSRKFQRTKENFVCEKCGENVIGDGYTNHCPRCIWSKHVDVNPGDRESTCHGLMKPLSVARKHGEFIITHQCSVCGFEKRQRAKKTDSRDVLFQLMQQVTEKS